MTLELVTTVRGRRATVRWQEEAGVLTGDAVILDRLERLGIGLTPDSVASAVDAVERAVGERPELRVLEHIDGPGR